MDDWTTLIQELAEEVELLAIDLPGFGRSDDVEQAPGMTALDTAADCAHVAVTQLGWQEPFYVVGHSHGAGVAQAIAARHPKSVAGLVLIASLGVPAHAAYQQLAVPGMATLLQVPAALVKLKSARSLMRGILRGIMRPMFAPVPLPEALVEQQLEMFLRRPGLFVQMSLAARGNPCKQLARDANRVEAPVLFIHGAEDELVPIAHARGIEALLSNAASVVFDTVPDAGHMLHVTHAKSVAALIASWLARVTGEQGGARSSSHQFTGDVAINLI